MKKLILWIITLAFINDLSAQGNRIITKQDGLMLSYNLDLVATVDGACSKDLNLVPGDKYKITVYLSNESGKKLIYTGGYTPIVSFVAPENGCWPSRQDVNINIPLNPGDIKQATKYFIIQQGAPSASIRVFEYILRGYKSDTGKLVKGTLPETALGPYYYCRGGSYNNLYAMISNIFSTSCSMTDRKNIKILFADFYAKHYSRNENDRLNDFYILGPFNTVAEAEKQRSEDITYYKNEIIRYDPRFILTETKNFTIQCK